jgi:hypothetical protein
LVGVPTVGGCTSLRWRRRWRSYLEAFTGPEHLAAREQRREHLLRVASFAELLG